MPAPASPLQPSRANVAYGEHERQVLDFWKAPSPYPTPLLLHIHGGGWVVGDKAVVLDLERYLAAGISVVSINYRFTTQAQIEGVFPPVRYPLEDCARALQFVRSQADGWQIDPVRIAASGESAGACSSLWLAFHPDLAQPGHTDPVARQSTRLWSAAVTMAQTTLDPLLMRLWTLNSRYGGHAFGFMPDPRDVGTRDLGFQQFYDARADLLPLIREYSPLAHVSAGDPPIYLTYANPPDPGAVERDPTHSTNFGVALQRALEAVGVECELVYPGASGVRYPTMADYLIARLYAGYPAQTSGKAPIQAR